MCTQTFVLVLILSRLSKKARMIWTALVYWSQWTSWKLEFQCEKSLRSVIFAFTGNVNMVHCLHFVASNAFTPHKIVSITQQNIYCKLIEFPFSVPIRNNTHTHTHAPIFLLAAISRRRSDTPTLSFSLNWDRIPPQHGDDFNRQPNSTSSSSVRFSTWLGCFQFSNLVAFDNLSSGLHDTWDPLPRLRARRERNCTTVSTWLCCCPF